MKKIISILILVIFLPILFVSMVILVDSYMNPDEVPSFFGWKPFIVLSGSMQTEIYAGDLAVVKQVNPETLKVGDVIAFRDDDIVITHRITKIIEEGETKYITKGDNNQTEDQGYVLPEQIEGVYKFKISRIGNLAMFIQTPIGIIVCLSIPLLILILSQVTDSRKNRKFEKEVQNREKEMEEEIQRLRKQNEELLKK